MPSRSFLPPTNKRVLLWAMVIIAACFFAAALAEVFLARDASELPWNIGFALVLVAVGVGLWRLNSLARGTAVFLLWAALLLDGILLLGTFNPFTARDIHAATGGMPTAPELALRVWPAIVAVPIIIAALHVLGKYKKDFGWRRAQPEKAPSEAI